VEQVGIYDSFFDLGGHSLLATQFIALIRDRFKVDIPIRAVFESPTIADLAAMVPQTLAAEENEDEMALLIAEVEHMSDEAVKTLLRKEHEPRKE
jgi:acyl carrier protein